MSACVNKVALLGNLGKDPEVREIPSGKVVSFSLATLRAGRTKKGSDRSAQSGTGWWPTMG
jgi:single-strand DNA-binding protein